MINGGNAFTAGLNPEKDAIYAENIDPKTNPYVGQLVNVIVSRTEDKDNALYQKIVKAYQTDAVAKTLQEAYQGAYTPAW